MDAVKGASRRASLPLLLPALLFLVLLFLYPFAYGLYLSLTKADGAPTIWKLRPLLLRRQGPQYGLDDAHHRGPRDLVNVGLAIPFSYYMRRGTQGGEDHHLFPHRADHAGDGPRLRGYAFLHGAERLAQPAPRWPFTSSRRPSGSLTIISVSSSRWASRAFPTLSDAPGLRVGHQPRLEKAGQMLGATSGRRSGKSSFP